ncbi:MAG: IclR family transcriptional regulator [Pseudomonadota bacterium]
MSAASKTLELLSFFTPAQPEIGLSQLCRLAGRDKATTHRHLQALEETGFVEQNPLTKRYRLGPAILQLAQTRELTVPRKDGVDAPLRALADATGETTHASILSGTVLYKLMACESPRHSIRVVIDIETFPLHATASGLCALAFGPGPLLDVARRPLTPFTPSTIDSADALTSAIEATRATGFGRALGTFETDVHSIAAPLFDPTGFLAGAVSVASVATRFTPELEARIKTHLITASRDITHNWGGTIPANVENAWANAVAQSKDLEPTP